jgi:hypothetical protein
MDTSAWTPMWQYEHGGRWDMCPELVDKLELAFAAGGAEMTHTVDENVEYDYDLTEMSQLRYEGRRPGTERSIRRVLINPEWTHFVITHDPSWSCKRQKRR